MIDIHCHILPGVDDGAATMEDALEMAYLASESGVRTIVATPHCCVPAFPPNYKSISLLERFNALRNEIAAAGIPLKIYAGAEILCSRSMPKLLEQGKLLTLASSKYFLVEFYFDSTSEYMSYMLDAVRANGLIPVIAHPERYDAVQTRPHLVEEWHDKGYIIQINKGSISGRLGINAQKSARWLLSHGLAHVVASDAHSSVKRTPMMDIIRRHLEDELLDGYARLLLYDNPRRIIHNKPVISIRDRIDPKNFEEF